MVTALTAHPIATVQLRQVDLRYTSQFLPLLVINYTEQSNSSSDTLIPATFILKKQPLVPHPETPLIDQLTFSA
jgi:hypothetical protein